MAIGRCAARSRRLVVGSLVVLAAAVGAQPPAVRTLDDRFDPPRITTLDAWTTRAAYLREHVLASAGLVPLPDKGAAAARHLP
jgi:hypothetical protein